MIFSTLERKLQKAKNWFLVKVVENSHFQLFGEYYYRIPIDEKVVALTFDDGPYDPYTTELLSVLEKHKTKATFFFVGNQIEKFPKVAKKAHDHQHQIANHSYSHPKFSFKGLRFIRNEIERTDSLIRELGVEYEIVFRAPFGNKFLLLPYVLWRKAKKHVLFDFFPNPRDWWGCKAEEVVWSILQQVRPGSILVLHDGNLTAAPFVCEYTDMLISKLKEKGYRFETVHRLIELGKDSIIPAD